MDSLDNVMLKTLLNLLAKLLKRLMIYEEIVIKFRSLIKYKSPMKLILCNLNKIMYNSLYIKKLNQLNFLHFKNIYEFIE